MKRFKEYKYELNYVEWSLRNAFEEIYAICSENDCDNIYFDVFEKDFEEMRDLGIVDFDGYSYLLNNPSEEQIAEYAKKWGIYWLEGHKDVDVEILNGILESHFNLFHSDMITRAATDDSIDKCSLLQGILEIMKSEECDDDDEFTPKVFENV